MKIVLYDEGAAAELDIEGIAQYLTRKIGKAGVEIRGNPFSGDAPGAGVSHFARRIACTKIQGINQKIQSGQAPLHGEIEYEIRRILGKTRSFGLIYDGFDLQRIISEVVPKRERNLVFIHIAFTNRLFATWDDINKRYHLRTSIYGFPSIISTTGLVEAPARPREYYLLKQQYEGLGKDITELKDSFKESFIDYADERLTDVARGYTMQAVFYALTGAPFCEDKGCSLYNAHWQEELIFAQLKSGYEFCQRHTEFLEKL